MSYPLCPRGHVMMKDPVWSMAQDEQYYECKICKFHSKGKR